MNVRKMKMAETSFRSSDKRDEKKVWRYLTAVPDHEAGHYVCVQELDGDWGTPNVDGHDANGWRDAEEPIATRVIVAKMGQDGALRNAFSPYNGNRFTQRDA